MARRAPILLTVITLSLSACGSGTDETVSTTAETSAASTGPTTGDVSTTGPTTGDASTTGATTGPTTGATTGPTTGGAACPDLFPQEGDPCSGEAEQCKTSACQDPCEGCEFVNCVDGTWVAGGSEVPGTCLDCASVCAFVVPAGCAGGPPDQAACVAGCMDSLTGECKLAYDEMLFCIGEMPTFTCDAATLPTVVGCEDRFGDLYMCLGL